MNPIEPSNEPRITESEWQDLLRDDIDAICLGGATWPGQSHSSNVIFPGAFNPLHEAHMQMAEIAGEMMGAVVEFEISIENVDKPRLEFTDIAARALQFEPQRALWITRAATFVEKAKLFPGATFVVGADTIARIGDRRYYGGDRHACRTAIEEIANRDCRFLVFCRQTSAGLQTLDNVNLPLELRSICDAVSDDRFSLDISSTRLRSADAHD